jgi:hypothetical protein
VGLIVGRCRNKLADFLDQISNVFFIAIYKPILNGIAPINPDFSEIHAFEAFDFCCDNRSVIFIVHYAEFAQNLGIFEKQETKEQE